MKYISLSLFFIFYCPLWAEISDNSVAYDASNYLEDVRCRFRISRAVADREDQWDPASGKDNPMPVYTALNLALELLRSKSEVLGSDKSWRLSNFELVPIHRKYYPQKWIWRVCFTKIRDPDIGSGPEINICFPILLSGKSADLQFEHR